MYEIAVISRKETREERMDKIVTKVSEEFSKDLAKIMKGNNMIKKDIIKKYRSGYKPSKAEMEEKLDLRNPDGSKPSIEKMMKGIFRPVKTRL